MIIQRLYEYYKTHKDSKDDEGNRLFPEYGYSEQKVSYVLSINKDGSFDSFQPAEKSVFLPDLGAVDIQKTRNPIASFFYGNDKYILGSSYDKAGKKLDLFTEREKMGLFIELHQKIYEKTEVKELKALLTFLSAWKDKKDSVALKDIPSVTKTNKKRGTNTIIKVDGVFLHEIPALVKYWNSYVNNYEGTKGSCMITGEQSLLRKLHGKIKGVQGTTPTGGSLVSFNKDAHLSYESDGPIVPVGSEVEFGYRTVLNFFTSSTTNSIDLGEDKIVFWTSRRANTLFEKVISFFFKKSEEEDTEAIILNGFQAIIDGRVPEKIPEDERFCIAVLSGCRGRVFVRDFMEHSVGEIIEKIHLHCNDIKLADNKKGEWIPSLRSLAWASLSGKSKTEKPHKSMYQVLMKSILEGSQYPYDAVVMSLQHCLKPEGMKRNRIALIKGFLNREIRNTTGKEFTMALDRENKDTGYLLGRMLALADHIQSRSIGHEVNRSFSDRYRASMSASPALVIKDIDDKVIAHLSKLKRTSTGMYVVLSKQYREIMSGLSSIPESLSTIQQVSFVLGYHHQFEDMFTKKS